MHSSPFLAALSRERGEESFHDVRTIHMSGKLSDKFVEQFQIILLHYESNNFGRLRTQHDWGLGMFGLPLDNHIMPYYENKQTK